MLRNTALLAGLLACFLSTNAVSAAEPVRAIGPDNLQAILEQRRGKIVVVNLWATWCAPCLTEIPDLITMSEDLADLDVTLIGISVDEPRANTDFIAAMRDKRFPEFVTYARDATEVDYLVSIIDPAWNEVVPTTYVIGRDGTLKKRIQGKKSLEDFKAEVLSADQ